MGIDPGQVTRVVNTHLHWDHCSNNHLFLNAKVFVQRAEVDYAVDPVIWDRVAYERVAGTEAEWAARQAQIEAVDGDLRLAPGVELVTLPGHTPGSQGVLVQGRTTRYLIAGDCVNVYENWFGSDRYPHLPSGLFTDLRAYERSFAKIESLGCEVIPSHDTRVVEHGMFE